MPVVEQPAAETGSRTRDLCPAATTLGRAADAPSVRCVRDNDGHDDHVAYLLGYKTVASGEVCESEVEVRW